MEKRFAIIASIFLVVLLIISNIYFVTVYNRSIDQSQSQGFDGVYSILDSTWSISIGLEDNGGAEFVIYNQKDESQYTKGEYKLIDPNSIQLYVDHKAYGTIIYSYGNLYYTDSNGEMRDIEQESSVTLWKEEWN